MSRDKVIQVQKKAQSLEQFQRRAAGGESPALKVVLIGAGLLVAGIVAWGAWSTHRQRQAEVFESQLASLRLQVEGDGSAPVAPEQLESRMRAALPQLQALVKNAPASREAEAQGLLASWNLDLTGQGGVPAVLSDPWGRLREAQRLTALGQGKEARGVLEPLRAKAVSGEAWSQAFWASLLEVDRLNGDRQQGMADLADYRTRFKDSNDSARFDKLVQSI
ncbi:MAG TPA: hypothetical protein VL181_08465 [Holophagaceae bacterium]|nr:hypothetical protein [Holophagaceae bacterium]